MKRFITVALVMFGALACDPAKVPDAPPSSDAKPAEDTTKPDAGAPAEEEKAADAGATKKD